MTTTEQLLTAAKGWANAAEPSWNEAVMSQHSSVTMDTAFIGIGIDMVRNLAALIEVMSETAGETDAG